MARTASPKTYAISYGLAGGPAHSRQLRKLLGAAGFRRAPLHKADIVIAHSAGCWLLPTDLKPTLVIYVGMPLAVENPRQTWSTATRLGARHSPVRHTVNNRLKNTYYQLLQPRRNIEIIRMAKHAQPVIFPGVRQAVFIANRHDPWPGNAGFLQNFAKNADWAFVGLPGTHDDIWGRPERYVEVIKHYARLLA